LDCRQTNKEAKGTYLTIIYISGSSRYFGRPSKNSLETQNRAEHAYGIRTVGVVITNSEIISYSNLTNYTTISKLPAK